jgi:hypothetical protein
MDGFRCVWHAGPFSHNPRFRFSADKLLFGTDPVAMDRILLEIIEEKRRAEGAISVWDRGKPAANSREFNRDPNLNLFEREPGHIEYAAGLGLGEYDRAKIDLRSVEL